MSGYEVRLSVFEGPLDLLLHLIEKQEVDIWQVSMAEVAQQYLDFIAALPQVELEPVGEYLAMAALLVRLKARHLLPHAVVEDEDDEEDELALEQALRERLAEYKRYKAISEVLDELAAAREQYGLRPLPMDEQSLQQDPGPPADFGVHRLTSAFLTLLAAERPEPRQPPRLRKVDLRGTMAALRRRLQWAEDVVPFHSLFDGASSRWDWIVTFLAVLELVHAGDVRVRQPELFAPVELQWAAAGD